MSIVSVQRPLTDRSSGRAGLRLGFGIPNGTDSAGTCLLAALVALVLLAAPLQVWPSEVPDAALERRVGHAFSLDTGEPVYREIHEPRVRDGRLIGDSVTYRAPAGTVIARKRVDFAERPLAPAFRLEDLRTGYLEGLEPAEGDRLALFHRRTDDAELRRGTIENQQQLVADAGFDLLIYRSIEALKQGQTLAFPFAVPSRLETIRFRLRMVDRRTVLGEPAAVIRMEPDSALLRWLVDPIDVAYHAETGALLRYEGVSNIPDPAAEGNYRVRIDFPPAGVEPEPPGQQTVSSPDGR